MNDLKMYLHYWINNLNYYDHNFISSIIKNDRKNFIIKLEKIIIDKNYKDFFKNNSYLDILKIMIDNIIFVDSYNIFEYALYYNQDIIIFNFLINYFKKYKPICINKNHNINIIK